MCLCCGTRACAGCFSLFRLQNHTQTPTGSLPQCPQTPTRPPCWAACTSWHLSQPLCLWYAAPPHLHTTHIHIHAHTYTLTHTHARARTFTDPVSLARSLQTHAFMHTLTRSHHHPPLLLIPLLASQAPRYYAHCWCFLLVSSTCFAVQNRTRHCVAVPSCAVKPLPYPMARWVANTQGHWHWPAIVSDVPVLLLPKRLCLCVTLSLSLCVCVCVRVCVCV